MEGRKRRKRRKIRTGEDVEKLAPLCIAGRNVKWCSHYVKQFGDFSKLNIKLPCDSAIPLLGTHPKELKVDIYILMFTEYINI